MTQAACVTHIGGRPNHEDNFLLDGLWLTPEMQDQMTNGKLFCREGTSEERVQLYAVCDGMGGHQAGEFASRLCIEQLCAARSEIQGCGTLQEITEVLQRCIEKANAAVCEAGRNSHALRGMGSTLVLAAMLGGEGVILHVGDSRAYLFQDDTLYQLTHDHTEGQRMLDLGLLTRRELGEFPARKNLNRYIGHPEPGYVLRADACEISLEHGVLLLCSDGISDELEDKQIADILRTERNLTEAGTKLVKMATASQQADNATALLLSLRG